MADEGNRSLLEASGEQMAEACKKRWIQVYKTEKDMKAECPDGEPETELPQVGETGEYLLFLNADPRQKISS